MPCGCGEVGVVGNVALWSVLFVSGCGVLVEVGVSLMLCGCGGVDVSLMLCGCDEVGVSCPLLRPRS